MGLRILGVALAAALLGAFALGNDFVLDDRDLVVRNPAVRSLSLVPLAFTRDYREPLRRVGLYRPLVVSSFAANHALSGLDPRAWHAVDLLLHAAVAVLALLWLERLTGRPALATGAALLFAVHAVHAEVLANVASGRPELLAALFVLLALLRFRPAGHPGGQGVSALGLAAFGAALLAKEGAATLLLVLPWVDVLGGAPGAGPRAWVALWRRRLPVYGAHALVLLAYLGARAWALEGGDWLAAERALDNPLHGLAPGWRALNAVWVGLHYAGLLLFPLHLAYDYSHRAIPLIVDAGDARLWAVVGALLAAGLAAWVAARRAPLLFFAGAFTLSTFSVVSNAVVPIGTILGERLLYLPSLGFCLGAAWVLDASARRWAPARAPAVFALCLALVAGLHAARAADRILDWRTENGLYLHDLAVQPRSFKVQSNGGAALAELGRHEEALAHYARAMEIAPDFPAPYRGSVLSLLALGRFPEAAARYEETLRFGERVPSVEAALREGLARGR